MALRCIAEANRCSEAFAEDLLHLVDFIHENVSIQQFLAAENVTDPGKQNALAELLDRRIHPLLVQFTMLIAAAGDIGLLKHIATSFAAITGEEQLLNIGDVESAVPLSADRITAIEDEVGKTLNRKVRLRPRVVNNILGGIRIKVGDFVIDGTLDTLLEQARLQLLQ